MSDATDRKNDDRSADSFFGRKAAERPKSTDGSVPSELEAFDSEMCFDMCETGNALTSDALPVVVVLVMENQNAVLKGTEKPKYLRATMRPSWALELGKQLLITAERAYADAAYIQADQKRKFEKREADPEIDFAEFRSMSDAMKAIDQEMFREDIAAMDGAPSGSFERLVLEYEKLKARVENQ